MDVHSNSLIGVGNASEELTPISKAFNELDRNIHELEMTIGELSDKIKPILGPENNVDVNGNVTLLAETSNVARLIENHNTRIAALCRHVLEIRNRVEL